jgi:hypothetical protein
MSLVRIGEVTIGSIQRMPAANVQGYEYRALRVGPPGEDLIYVGNADTQLGAMNLIGRSLVARALDDRIPPDKRARLAEALNQLEGLGLGDISSFIKQALS